VQRASVKKVESAMRKNAARTASPVPACRPIGGAVVHDAAPLPARRLTGFRRRRFEADRSVRHIRANRLDGDQT
jgi:hypothetical protein